MNQTVEEETNNIWKVLNLSYIKRLSTGELGVKISFLIFNLQYKARAREQIMNFTNIPIIEFYEHCLNGARRKDYKWLVTLLVRQSDVNELYDNLQKAWYSLDSITGKYILFIFAGKVSRTYEERLNLKVIDKYQYWVDVNNDYLSFLNENAKIYDNKFQYDWNKNNRNNMEHIAENQTMAINELRDYFSLSEIDIPCFVFTSLDTRVSQTVPIVGNDIYGFFKNFFNDIDSEFRILDKLSKEEHNLSIQALEIGETLTKLTNNQKNREEEIINTWNALMEYSDIFDSDGQSLVECVSKLIYGKFESPIRSTLNKYIDLAHNYERKTNNKFDITSIKEEVKNKPRVIQQKRLDLMHIEGRLSDLRREYFLLVKEIEVYIGSRNMSESKDNRSKQSIIVNGGNVQINNAFDNARIENIQNNGIDIQQLSILLDRVKETIPKDLSTKDIEVLGEYLEEIRYHASQDLPKKSLLKKALTGLSAIKSTAEFGAAIFAVTEFIQKML